MYGVLTAFSRLSRIPSRPFLVILRSVAGAVSGFDAALDLSRRWGGRMSLSRLFEDAIYHAREGIPVTASQSACTAAKQDELRSVPGALLLQDVDRPVANRDDFEVKTRREPTEDEWRDLLFAWRVVPFVRSNAMRAV